MSGIKDYLPIVTAKSKKLKYTIELKNINFAPQNLHSWMVKMT